MTGTYPITFSPDGIPDELKQYPFWCVWRGFKGRKIPRCVDDRRNAKLSEPSTLATFEQAVAVSDRPLFSAFDGLAMFLSKRDEYFCLDLDSCVAGNVLSNWAFEIVQAVPGYVDVSPSGTGVKIIAKGPVPDWINCRKSFRLPRFVSVCATKNSEGLVIREGMVTLTGVPIGPQFRTPLRTERLLELCDQWQRELTPSPQPTSPTTSTTVLPPESAASAVERLMKCRMPAQMGDGSSLLYSLIFFMIEKWKFSDADVHAVVYAYHLRTPLLMLAAAADKREVVQTRIAQVRQRSGIMERSDLQRPAMQPVFDWSSPMW